jgi:light-regulated signal transduction histidine kinase (bacteriophytochrome)
MEEVLNTLDLKVEEMGARITCDELPEAVVSPSQFRQLFQNLISNALKFSRKSIPPDIIITYEYLSPAVLDTENLKEAKRYLKIDVTDNGIGFDNAFVDKIFGIFQRLHGKHEYEGTGIGLAICKKIVENHGGRIAAHGRPNEGATFTIIIPV